MDLSPLDPSNQKIYTLWIGDELSTMEELSLRSFIYHGHSVELFTYGPVKNIPENVTIKAADDVLPYNPKLTPSWFSNLFRYTLLHEYGGIWADLDVVCMKPLDFAKSYVFAGQKKPESQSIVGSVLKAPIHSELMAALIEYCEECIKSGETFQGQVGPLLLTWTLKQEMQEYLQFVIPWQQVNPINWDETEKLLDPESDAISVLEDKSVYTIHLWNLMWKLSEHDKSIRYPEGCVFAKLCQRYLPDY